MEELLAAAREGTADTLELILVTKRGVVSHEKYGQAMLHTLKVEPPLTVHETSKQVWARVRRHTHSTTRLTLYCPACPASTS